MSKRTYQGRTLTGKCLEITIDGKFIAGVKELADDLQLPYLLPVMVDLQHNGAFGIEFNRISMATDEELLRVSTHMRRHGVGRCLASFATQELDVLSASMASLDKRLEVNEELSNLYPGFFQEGVFISSDPGWRGAHQVQFIKGPDFKLFLKLWDASGRRIKVVNVAPEIPGAIEFIEQAVELGIRVAIGHCNPDPEAIGRAVDAGASMITHFGNGANPLIKRFDNPFWAMLSEPGLAPGLICDGCHLPSEFVKVVLKCKGKNCFIVSDSSFFAGSPPGEYIRSDGSKVIVTPEFRIHTLKDHDILAGAWPQLDKGVEFLATRCGVEFTEAWKYASVYPARLAGISLPRIKVGDNADFVVAEMRKETLQIIHSVHSGRDYRNI